MDTGSETSRDDAILKALARAIWQSDTASDRPEDQADRNAQWQEAKKDAMRKARNVLKRLEKRGVHLAMR